MPNSAALLLKTALKHFVVQPLRTYRNPYYEVRFRSFAVHRGASDVGTPRDLFRGVSDNYLLWLLTYAPQLGYTFDGVIPYLPSDDMQRNWTGAFGETTMREALQFAQIIRQMVERYTSGLHLTTTILDFGCGWGRVLRFFLRDVNPQCLFGSDCYAEALAVARKHNRWSNFVLNDSLPPAPFEENSFDVIYLFSVFSHLSEEAHLRWIESFQRLLKPGGLLIATTRPRSFILKCAELRSVATNAIEAGGAASSFKDTELFLQRYDAGEFCHSSTGGGGPLSESLYGESCIPEAYVRRVWAQRFDVQAYRPADRKCNQDVICVKKR
ncbi:MAG: class I SAM-dependent methyltransferase [Herpetosiphonaceae bacterium]|nr:class I SAM-dependent methyltransferase [Herpetosiphonaceae bacterium]